jgi:hypothetical protein
MDITYLSRTSSDDLVASIEKLQRVQRQNPPSSDDWINASECLEPLFAEMARRTERAS